MDSMNRIAQIANRMNFIAPFEVMEIQTRARALEALGHEVIHLEVGQPDFLTPPQIVNAAKAALDTIPMNYTSACGITPLREAIATHYKTAFGVNVDPASVVVTAGSSAALLLAFGVLLNAGDEVLMADPGYPCNRHFIRTLEAIPTSIAVDADTDYQLNAQHVADHWSARTVATLIASPANPTGTVVSAVEMAKIAAATRARGGTLIVDEIYNGLTYDSAPASVLQLADCDDVFVINSFSKYFQMTGWRLGWMIVPEKYRRAVEILAQNLFISPPANPQYAALAGFSSETIALLEERRSILRERRNFLLAQLPSLGFSIPVVPQGAFYIYADSSAIAPDSDLLARRILDEAQIAITPGKDFGNHAASRHLRIAYTQPVETLAIAIERLRRIL
jgi:aspartate/methionine/tyrosine aminotransferase